MTVDAKGRHDKEFLIAKIFSTLLLHYFKILFP
jgi:hypothetical protein